MRTFEEQVAEERASRKWWLERCIANAQTMDELEKITGLTRGKIYHHASDLGVQIKNAFKITRTLQDYVECAEKGMTVREAARLLDVSYGTVNTMAHRYGLEFQKPAALSLTEADYRAAAEKGMTLSEAAKHLRVSKATIANAEKRFGVSFGREQLSPGLRKHKEKKAAAPTENLPAVQSMADFAAQEQAAMRARGVL